MRCNPQRGASVAQAHQLKVYEESRRLQAESKHEQNGLSLFVLNLDGSCFLFNNCF